MQGGSPIHPVLQANQFFVKEHVGIFKAANNDDIFDPVSRQKVMECREPSLGLLTRLLRFTDCKRMTPFHVEIRTPDGQKVLSVRRGISLLRSTVEVRDERERPIGKFKQRLLSIGGRFDVLDWRDQPVCTLKGKWTSWAFRFMEGEEELAAVSKKWAGLGKELFTSADNDMLNINPRAEVTPSMRILILASVMCIDMVLKE